MAAHVRMPLSPFPDVSSSDLLTESQIDSASPHQDISCKGLHDPHSNRSHESFDLQSSRISDES